MTFSLRIRSALLESHFAAVVVVVVGIGVDFVVVVAIVVARVVVVAAWNRSSGSWLLIQRLLLRLSSLQRARSLARLIQASVRLSWVPTHTHT